MLHTVNYWAGYGGQDVRLWLRLFGENGTVLATWEIEAPKGAGGIAFDSRKVRARFGLGPFTGQLFIYVIGAVGHDVVKYVLETCGNGQDASLSCTHDANGWPSARYAGIPAPTDEERVILWVQNSHARPIPDDGVALSRMGDTISVKLPHAIPGFATVALDVSTLLPDCRWPDQIEMHAGYHVVRPRYEVTRHGRTRIAHANVERADLKPDPRIAQLYQAFGRGFLLALPVLPRCRYRTLILPTPMAETQETLPLRLEVFDHDGNTMLRHFVGCLPRGQATAIDLDVLLPADALQDGGHAELVYDFRDGGSADGWLHALVRAEDRASRHAAESSFESHIFNTAMVFGSEPQSYSGPPPGLSTRLALPLSSLPGRSFALLIYPSSADWHQRSDTSLVLHDAAGEVLAMAKIAIAQSGSLHMFPDQFFTADEVRAAGSLGYVMVRDTTCRLFGYHGVVDDFGRFSLDHMFGF